MRSTKIFQTPWTALQNGTDDTAQYVLLQANIEWFEEKYVELLVVHSAQRFFH